RLAPVAAHNDCFGALKHFALPSVEINRTRRPPRLVDLDLANITTGADLAISAALSHRNYGGQRARFGAHLAAEAFTESAMQARTAASVWLRQDRQRCGKRMQSQIAGRALEDYTRGFHRQRRQRIRLRTGRIERAGAGKP